mgnify:CR=1 FL=1
MRIIIVIVFIIVCAYVGINTIKNFSKTIENHNQRIERVAGY